MKVGLLGAGLIAQAHMPAWNSLGHDVLVYSIDGAAELTAEFGGRVVASREELFEECDVVDICTPTHTHSELIKLAAAAGKHVMCEKPLCRTGEDAIEAVRVCENAGVLLFPAHVVRYFPAYATAKEAVMRGDVGRLGVLRFSRTTPFPNSHGWYADEEKSGGMLMDLMIHDLDQARWFAGEVDSIYTIRNQARGSTPSIGSTQAVLTHESGAISYCQSTWASPGTTFRTTFEIAGDRGVLAYDSRANPGLMFDGMTELKDPTGYLPPATTEESPYMTEIRDFAAAASAALESPHTFDEREYDSSKWRLTPADGVAAVELALAGMESLATGQRIEMSTFTRELRRER